MIGAQQVAPASLPKVCHVAVTVVPLGKQGGDSK